MAGRVTAARRKLTPRAEKSIRLTIASAVCAIPGLWGIATHTVWLGYLAAAIPLFAIVLGPISERYFTR
jgi:hypothetical protein